MELNKNYYMSLDDKFKVVSGEVDHKPIDASALNIISEAIQAPLDSGKLLTGDHLQVTEGKCFDHKSGKTTTYKVAENLANISVGEHDTNGEAKEGFIRVVEYNTHTRMLRLWIQDPDYKKQTSSASDELSSEDNVSF